jgi:hypothetical protein
MAFETKMLWRNKVFLAVILVSLFAGLYGIFYGKKEFKSHQLKMDQVEAIEREGFDSLLVWASLDTAIESNKL